MTAPVPALLGMSAAALSLQHFFGPPARQVVARNRDSSSLTQAGRTIVIVTTAALPWMTGTSVNPTLRAAYLNKMTGQKVVLMVPWVPLEDQKLIFPNDLTFDSEVQQTSYIADWVEKRTGMPCNFKIYFYPARYRQGWGSIFPTSDIPALIPKDEADIALLEEPEHLNWFQHSSRWTDRFPHVVGIIHTNYVSYIRQDKNGGGYLNAAAVYRITKWACRIHCHKVVKLSDAVQGIPRSVICNVHGVSSAFIDLGRSKAALPPPRYPKGAYFIGKVLWAKGYTELLTLLTQHQESGHPPVEMDVVGKGEDLEAVQQLAVAKKLQLTFLGAKDHLDPSLHDYKVFVNPSRSDVVATTTAEALAMGRWVVVEDLPCNEFFKQFPNTLTYTTTEQFSQHLLYALQHEPHPMDADTSRKLSWEAATERLLDVAEMKPGQWPTRTEAAYDNLLWKMYKSLAGMEVLRQALGMTSPSGEEVPPTEPTTPVLQRLANETDAIINSVFGRPTPLPTSLPTTPTTTPTSARAEAAAKAPGPFTVLA